MLAGIFVLPDFNEIHSPEVPAQALESKHLGLYPGFTDQCFGSLADYSFVPNFPQISFPCKVNTNTYLVILWWGLNEITDNFKIVRTMAATWLSIKVSYWRGQICGCQEEGEDREILAWTQMQIIVYRMNKQQGPDPTE